MPADSAASRPIPQTISLRGGQSLRLSATPGSVLHVAAGRARLHTAPAWLAQTIHQAQHRLAAGDVYRIETAGWIVVESEAGAELTLRQAPARPGRVARLLVRWPVWGLLRRPAGRG